MDMRKNLSVAVAALVCAAAFGQEAKSPEWRVSLSSNVSSKLIQVCLYRDKATAGFLSRGHWKAALGFNPPEPCAERMTADTSQRILFLAIPGFGQRGAYLAGRADAYCDQSTEQTGYSPCTSDFFTHVESQNYRVVSPYAIKSAVKESGLIALLEADIEREREALAKIERTAYLQAYERAGTLEGIRKFEAAYAGNDPDGLIHQLSGRKAELEHKEYRERFSSAKSREELSAFVADYEGNDPETLVPDARRKLLIAEKQATAEKEVAQKQSEIDKVERQIAWCKNQSAQAQKAIDRENQIGLVSGYVNTVTLHQAGEIIVLCQESIPRHYAEYRRLGGVKPLAAIR